MNNKWMSENNLSEMQYEWQHLVVTLATSKTLRNMTLTAIFYNLSPVMRLNFVLLCSLAAFAQLLATHYRYYVAMNLLLLPCVGSSNASVVDVTRNILAIYDSRALGLVS